MKIMDVEMFGGPGKAHFEHVLTADEMHGMNRVYARVTLKPACAVGYHVHQGGFNQKIAVFRRNACAKSQAGAFGKFIRKTYSGRYGNPIKV